MFRFLEHPSEEYVEVQAATTEEVFQEAAVALFEIMTDTSKVATTERFDVALEASERNFLFVDWLNRLILIHEVEKVFLSKFKVLMDAGWKLSAVVQGEKISHNHELRAHAKSVTFGQFVWNESKEGHLVRFLVDI